MAEVVAVVGVTASVVQLVEISTKLIIRINEFSSSMDKCPRLFHDLQVRLPLLSQTLNQIAARNQGDGSDQSLKRVIDECLGAVTLLEKKLDKTLPVEGDSGIRRRWKAVRSLSREKSVRDASDRIDRYLNVLTFYQGIQNGHQVQVSVSTTANQPESSTTRTYITIDDPNSIIPFISDSNQAPQALATGTTSLSEPITTRAWASTAAMFDSRTHCLKDRCICACHETTSSSGKFWSWNVSSPWALVRPCDRPSCQDRTFKARYHVSLSRLKIPWSVEFGFRVAYGLNGYSISSTLQPVRVVPFTSPGFVVLWKCRTHQIAWPEAKQSLQKLFDEGKASPLDVDPAGKTWLEKILNLPWSVPAREAQFGLLEVLLQRQAQHDTNDSLLWLCARWIGEGPHMHALEILLNHGYDVSLANSHSLCRWPDGREIFWGAVEHIVLDPFFLELVARCVNTCPGFGETTSLMASIMANDKNQMDQLLQKSCSLLERNYLGQTALHLAVLRPKLLVHLVVRFDNLDVDMPDRHGVTPLMYAATYGEDESVITLLRAGANLWKRNDLNHRNFLDFALGREKWNVLYRTIQDCKLLYSPSRSQSIVDYVTVCLLMAYTCPLDRSTHLRRLLSSGADPNVTCPDGSTLLHHVREPDEAEALFEAGFRRINDPDKGGVLPLMKLVHHSCPTLVQKCLERGASVSDQDDQGWTVLHYAVQELLFTPLHTHGDRSSHEETRRACAVITIIRLLLRHGADPRARDYCPCACSQAGCTPSTVLLGNSRFPFFGDYSNSWTLEWVQVISETVPERVCREICRVVLIEMVRAMRFRLTELVHVCCRRSLWSRVTDDDIDNILDEQSIEIQELDDCLEILDTGEIPDYTETWIQELAKYVTEYKAPASGAQDFDAVDFFARRYVVDTKRDEFRSKMVEFGPDWTTADMIRRINIQAYMDWVAYCYDHKAEFAQCAEMDEDWRERRIRSALRLRQVLEERRLEGGNEIEEC
ncbi:hypothetical protein LTR67_006542 [Exophiala xenobiotica]